MKTVALRFSDRFAPSEGTIVEHKKVIDKKGFVWYGKLGARISKPAIDSILEDEEPRILLIQSGIADRYWAFIDCVTYDIPPKDDIPSYYCAEAERFGTWFRVTKIVSASKDVLAKCKVVSSNRPLFQVLKSSMSPFFIIKVEEKNL